MNTDEKLDLLLEKVSALETKLAAAPLATAAPFELPPKKPTYSLKEAAQLLGWSISHTRRQQHARILRTTKTKPYRVLATEIDRHLGLHQPAA